MCGWMAMADMRDERYEVNHCNERDELPNQVQTIKQDEVVKSIKDGRQIKKAEAINFML